MMANSTIQHFIALIVILLCFIEAECRTCWYNGHGYTKYFYCAPNEYCCGPACCQSVVSFYRLWYFWLCIIMALLFCSGGGYWFRSRYSQQRVIVNRGGGSSGVVLQTAPQQQRIGMTGQAAYYPQAHSQPKPPDYTAQGAQYPPHPATYQYQSYGPPPSYDTVYAASGVQQPQPPATSQLAPNGNAASTH